MVRHRKGRAIDGIVLLDKPTGLSSNHAMQRVRGIYCAQKAGHGGTLDPFANGLLPILLGEATKFGRFLLNADKTYEVTLVLGEETDTDDHTGEVIRRAAIPNIGINDWQALLSRFLGTQMQTPPIYSALKVNGERAYTLARLGQPLEMTARPIVIHQLELCHAAFAQATLRVKCSKGTYIRSLVRDIGRELGSAAHAVSLRRCAIGNLDIRHAQTLQTLSSLREIEDNSTLNSYVLPLEACVSSLPYAVISNEKLHYFCHGNDVALPQNYPDGEYAFYHDGHLLGVGTICNNRAYPKRLRRRIESHL